MGEDAIGVFANEIVYRLRPEIKSRNDREDGCTGVGGQAHVAYVNFVQRGFAYAEYERTALFQANIGGAFDELCCEAVCDLGECSHAARDDDHRVGRVGTAGDVSANVVVALHVDLLRRRAEYLLNQVAAAGDPKFFGHDAQRAVAGNEVDGFDALVVLQRKQQLFQESCSAGAGGGDG